MLFSLAQAINRIRSGWMPPGPGAASAVAATTLDERRMTPPQPPRRRRSSTHATARSCCRSTLIPAWSKPANADAAALAAITASAGLPGSGR